VRLLGIGKALMQVLPTFIPRERPVENLGVLTGIAITAADGGVPANSSIRVTSCWEKANSSAAKRVADSPCRRAENPQHEIDERASRF